MDFKDLQGQKTVPEAFMEQPKDYDAMKLRLITEMVGKEAHANRLQNVPHMDMEDMAVTYRFLLNRTAEGQSTIPLTNDLSGYYGITTEQLHQDAMESAQHKAILSPHLYGKIIIFDLRISYSYALFMTVLHNVCRNISYSSGVNSFGKLITTRLCPMLFL